MADLVIFDCDGTLVNSEHVYSAITAQLLNDIGYAEYTPALCMELFGGHSWTTIRKTLEARHGETMPKDLIERYIKAANAQMDHDFEAMAGANDVLARVSAARAICVGSNGERNNVIKSLKVTGLLHHFDETRIFTKIQVDRPKPAPDLFLFACENMGVAPARSLVIEDSPTGVRASVAAGIRVIGFVGGAIDQDKQAVVLRDAGADVVVDSLVEIEGCF